MSDNGFMRRQWAEIRKGGSAAFSTEQMLDILEGGNDRKMLGRQEVLNRVLSYFNGCIRTAIEEDTEEKVATWVRNPTKSGLALCLGIDKQTLLDYVKGINSEGRKFSSENPDYKRTISVDDFDILRRAYSLIENFYEEQLALNKNNAGVIYWLNNANNTKWSNEQEFKFGVTEEPERRILAMDELPVLDYAGDIKDTGQQDTMTLPYLDDGEAGTVK